MPLERDLLGNVDAIGRTEWSGQAFRHTSPSRDPLQGFGAYLHGGRWNPSDSFSTSYLAQPEEACIAEFLRMAEGQARGPSSFLPRDVYTLAVSDLEVLDLRPPNNLAKVGLSVEDIQSRERGRCQEIGAAAHFLGFQGIVAPSATGIGIVIAAFDGKIRDGQLTVVEKRALADLL